MPNRKTPEQLKRLQEAYQKDKHPDHVQIHLIADRLGLQIKAVRTWFNNQRAKDRKAELKNKPQDLVSTKGNTACAPAQNVPQLQNMPQAQNVPQLQNVKKTVPVQNVVFVDLTEESDDYSDSPAVVPPMKQCFVDYIRTNQLPNCTEINLNSNNYDFADNALAYVINQDFELRSYFGRRSPDLLSGSRYHVLSSIGQGSYGRVILAQDINTLEKVVVKIPLNFDGSVESMRSMLLEFMHQEQAHNLLQGTKCTSPRPIGFIRIVNQSLPLGYNILTVSEFVPVVPDARCTLTMTRAVQEHVRGNPLLEKDDWLDVILALIDATDTLHRNDMYHNDIKLDNIMLRLEPDNKPRPVLIDFGLASSYNSFDRQLFQSCRDSVDIYNHHNAPETFLQLQPIATSDLYSVARTMELIGQFLKLPVVRKTAEQYCKMSPETRTQHVGFKKIVHASFVATIYEFNHLRAIVRQLYPPQM